MARGDLSCSNVQTLSQALVEIQILVNRNAQLEKLNQSLQQQLQCTEERLQAINLPALKQKAANDVANEQQRVAELSAEVDQLRLDLGRERRLAAESAAKVSEERRESSEGHVAEIHRLVALGKDVEREAQQRVSAMQVRTNHERSALSSSEQKVLEELHSAKSKISSQAEILQAAERETKELREHIVWQQSMQGVCCVCQGLQQTRTAVSNSPRQEGSQQLKASAVAPLPQLAKATAGDSSPVPDRQKTSVEATNLKTTLGTPSSGPQKSGTGGESPDPPGSRHMFSRSTSASEHSGPDIRRPSECSKRTIDVESPGFDRKSPADVQGCMEPPVHASFSPAQFVASGQKDVQGDPLRQVDTLPQVPAISGQLAAKDQKAIAEGGCDHEAEKVCLPPVSSSTANTERVKDFDSLRKETLDNLRKAQNSRASEPASFASGSPRELPTSAPSAPAPLAPVTPRGLPAAAPNEPPPLTTAIAASAAPPVAERLQQLHQISQQRRTSDVQNASMLANSSNAAILQAPLLEATVRDAGDNDGIKLRQRPRPAAVITSTTDVAAPITRWHAPAPAPEAAPADAAPADAEKDVVSEESDEDPAIVLATIKKDRYCPAGLVGPPRRMSGSSPQSPRRFSIVLGEEKQNPRRFSRVLRSEIDNTWQAEDLTSESPTSPRTPNTPHRYSLTVRHQEGTHHRDSKGDAARAWELAEETQADAETLAHLIADKEHREEITESQARASQMVEEVHMRHSLVTARYESEEADPMCPVKKYRQKVMRERKMSSMMFVKYGRPPPPDMKPPSPPFSKRPLQMTVSCAPPGDDEKPVASAPKEDVAYLARKQMDIGFIASHG